MASITVFGREYPLFYTVAAQDRLAKRFGKLEHIKEAFDTELGAAAVTDNAAFIASALMQGAEERERVRCIAFGEEFLGHKALTYEQLCAVLHPTEIGEVMKQAMAAMKDGSQVTVEAEAKSGKNADATQ